MTPEQRERSVELLREGATLAEVGALVGMSEPAWARGWTEGRRDSNDELDTEAAQWHREAQAARAQCRASLRAEAREERGTRAATDALAVLKALEDEVEPVEIERDPGDTRIPIERYSEETQMALHAAFSMMVNEDTARRVAA